MRLVSIKRLDFFANFGYFRGVPWLLQLKALQLIVLKKIVHAILKENDAFNECLYVELLQYLLPAFRQVLHRRPFPRLPYSLEELVNVILEESAKVYRELILVHLSITWWFENADSHRQLESQSIISLKDEQRSRDSRDQTSNKRKHC
jgi:hypothetical protein